MLRITGLLLAALLALSCDRTITINEPSPTPQAPPSAPSAPAAPPIVGFFGADSTRLAFGQQTLLHWEVDDEKALVRIDPYPGNVPVVGSTVVTATNTGPLFFILTARNAAGSTQRFVTIIVN